MNSFVLALGLFFVLEGALPFILPRQWRRTMQRVVELSDGQIRFVGLMALAFGLAILAFA